ncbi:MAG: hypothetical protein ACREHC_01430 [Candidatus Levyibacteriota bacterium]
MAERVNDQSNPEQVQTIVTGDQAVARVIDVFPVTTSTTTEGLPFPSRLIKPANRNQVYTYVGPADDGKHTIKDTNTDETLDVDRETGIIMVSARSSPNKPTSPNAISRNLWRRELKKGDVPLLQQVVLRVSRARSAMSKLSHTITAIEEEREIIHDGRKIRKRYKKPQAGYYLHPHEATNQGREEEHYSTDTQPDKHPVTNIQLSRAVDAYIEKQRALKK